MYQIILLIHVFAALCIVALVLVQQGKGATVGAAFGSGASQTVFGSRGSGSFLFRVTMSIAAIFFVTSLGLNYLATKRSKEQRVITLPASQGQSLPASGSNDASPATLPLVPADIPERK